jgi:hypothetical protein
MSMDVGYAIAVIDQAIEEECMFLVETHNELLHILLAFLIQFCSLNLYELDEMSLENDLFFGKEALLDIFPF